jgi:hypothetical protein
VRFEVAGSEFAAQMAVNSNWPVPAVAFRIWPRAVR